ncbi:MAG: hypothetical protein ACREES_09965 [Stellaceae bacterium]
MNWADLYGLVATSCGYTWPEIDAMSLSAVRELLDYWSRHPPVHLLLAAALRVAPKSKPARAGFADLAALAPGGVLSAGATRKP